jgi:hypothetical protein
MAIKQYTKKLIENAIDQQLADNSSQAITAANVRSVVKDYMTSSMYAPVLIYSGIIKHDEGSGTAAESIKELYFNPDFFAKQLVNDPTNAYNIYKLSNTTAAASNNSYTVSPSGGSGEGLVVTLTVSSNTITAMEINQAGGGYKEGDVLVFTVGGSSINMTYNAAIRKTSGAVFNMTQNTDNTFMNHKINNTIVSATPMDFSLGTNESFSVQNEVTSLNTIVLKLDTGSTYNDHYQHIQLYRVAGI